MCVCVPAFGTDACVFTEGAFDTSVVKHHRKYNRILTSNSYSLFLTSNISSANFNWLNGLITGFMAAITASSVILMAFGDY